MTEKENLLSEAYNAFMDVGLHGHHSLDILEKICAKDLMGYGTTIDEKITSLSAFRELLARQREQSAGMELQWNIAPVFRRMIANGNSAVFADDVTLTVKLKNENLQMQMRFSCVFEFVDGKWLAVHWHGSKPENVESEMDTFGIEEWKQKTIELEKLVEQRTADLLEKNKELERTLSQLKSTQTQLIQSEKMASLGELTAGIAHEIQNPLNFVNNFSEVNSELIEELNGERQKAEGERNALLEDELLNDLSNNLEKINHHGKRADAIVKGMLQHSRSSNGVNEPTDINALCDEYLRLSYHGLRAKDKVFNASMKTDFDESIGNINIIPQDIGRVLLNLINNAFYAVAEKKKALPEVYEPTVSVSSKKMNGNVEIKVTDNGNGIPQNIVDKIFQPFFTTKPTGQGTGLGLSLAYDIIKAHGGEIKVDTKECEGTTFIILIPHNNS